MSRKRIEDRLLTPDERIAKAAREERMRHEAESKRQIRRYRGYRMGGLGSLPGWIRQALQIVLAIVVVLAADGIRRESQEFQARVFGFSGETRIQRNNEPGWVPVLSNSTLEDGDSISTGAASYVILVFPEGSAIQLDPNTQLTVRELEYTRNGMRTRSFMVDYGKVTARVSNYYGYNSMLTICSPTSIVFVRGSGVSVAYNRFSNVTTLQSYDGFVDFQSGYNTVRCAAGAEISSEYYDVSRPTRIPPNELNLLQKQIYSLSIHEKEPGYLTDLEYKVNAFCDPVLQFFGFSAGGWSYGRTDFFRRNGCKQALTDLQAAIESSPTRSAPPFLNPVTLAELQLSPTETKDILKNFHGMMLQSYVRQASDRYTVLVRARDKKKTLFEMNEVTINELKGQ